MVEVAGGVVVEGGRIMSMSGELGEREREESALLDLYVPVWGT